MESTQKKGDDSGATGGERSVESTREEGRRQRSDRRGAERGVDP